ncbi:MULTISPECIES: hypothetical protein [unclassified Moraxella]|uniref:hypothetical protein n=1 Tax=unclassified Moraxella TaxID=2685852 RepID=UPI003AF7639E
MNRSTNLAKINKKASKLYHQSEEFGWNVPKVMQKRISMISQQNPLDNAKEMREIEKMFMEKPWAFLESWQQMMLQSLITQQNFNQSMFDNWLKFSIGQPIAMERVMLQLSDDTLKIFEKAMQPIYSTVNANAKRLKNV